LQEKPDCHIIEMNLFNHIRKMAAHDESFTTKVDQIDKHFKHIRKAAAPARLFSTEKTYG